MGSDLTILTRFHKASFIDTACFLQESLGESNAVFLRGVGGDAATEPHKTGCSGYPEEEFSGTHMDLNASMFKPGESIRASTIDWSFR